LDLILLLLYFLFFAFSTAFIAEIKNYNPKKWLFIGFTLGILALVVIIIQPENNVSDTI